MLKVEYGSPADIEQWMDLVRLVRSNFPGLETEEALEEHRRCTAVFQEPQYDLLPGGLA